MLPRQERLFRKIIQIYIKTAQPVGSLKLAAGGLSSATIRHEMIILEQEGLIYQPHTSAGRVPTEKGYRSYVENFVDSGKIDRISRQKLAALGRRGQGEEKVKAIARAAADLSEEAVIVAFNPNRLYFTGLSYLFAKPEFREQAQVTSLSQVLDHCEEVMSQVLESLFADKRILIGRENPFSPLCSFIAAPLKEEGLFGLLGPMRMDYNYNLGLVQAIEEIINK